MQINHHMLPKYDERMGVTQRANNKADEAKSPNRQQPDSASSRLDGVEFSTRSKDMQRIKDTLQHASDVREIRIKELAHAVAQGKLNLNGMDIAGKLLLDAGHGTKTTKYTQQRF